MVIHLSTLPPKIQKRWELLRPLLLKDEYLNVERVTDAWGCTRNTTMDGIRAMRNAGLPIPQISQQETVDCYGYCPECVTVPLSVAFITPTKAVRYCPECAWDAELDDDTPPPQVVSLQEAASLLKCGTTTIRRWIATGKLPVWRKAHHARAPLFIPRHAVEEILSGVRE